MTYKLANYLVPFDHVSTVARLHTNLFTLLQFKSREISL